MRFLIALLFVLTFTTIADAQYGHYIPGGCPPGRSCAQNPNDQSAPMFRPNHHRPHYNHYYNNGYYPNQYYMNPGFIPPGYYVPNYQFRQPVTICECTRINPYNGMHFIVGYAWGTNPYIAGNFCLAQNAYTGYCQQTY